MNDKVIILAVGGIIAIGTFFYYAFFEKKKQERPMSSRPSRSSHSSNRSEPLITHSPRNNRRINTEREQSTTSQRRKDTMKSDDNRNLDSPSPNQLSSARESSKKPCRACSETANAKFLPCGHIEFCVECAYYYLSYAEKSEEKINARCPYNNCDGVVSGID